AVTVVVKERLAHGIVGHKNIRQAVTVKIGKRQTETFAGSVRDLRTTAHILERAVRFLMKKKIGRGLEIVGMTKRAVCGARAKQLKQVTGLAAEDTANLEVPVHVAQHEEVQTPIVVVAEPAGTRRPAGRSESRFAGDIFEGAVPQVAVQNVAAITRNV